MQIEKAHSRNPGGGGFVLFGNNPTDGKFFERWYPTIDKALQYANRKGWDVQNTDGQPLYWVTDNA